MKIAATVTTALIVAAVAPVAVSGFANPATKIASGVRTATTLHGYLDDLSKELYQPVDQPEGDDSHQATDLDKKQVDRYGVGNWNDYVEFDEFDGGDGQMGVAGDGNKVSQKQRQKERERERETEKSGDARGGRNGERISPYRPFRQHSSVCASPCVAVLVIA